MAVTLDPQNGEGKILPMAHLVSQITVSGLIIISWTYSGEWLEVSFDQHAYQPLEQTTSVKITFHIVCSLCDSRCVSFSQKGKHLPLLIVSIHRVSVS